MYIILCQPSRFTDDHYLDLIFMAPCHNTRYLQRIPSYYQRELREFIQDFGVIDGNTVGDGHEEP
jgi:hypothetical protein